MRVLVEFFDKEPMENVLASCIFQPGIVVFLCDARDSTFLKESAIYRFFRRRKMKTKPRFYYLNVSNPAEIRRVLAAVARDYPSCVFNFTGGRDLVLVTAGAFSAERSMPGFYISLPYGHFVDLQGCGEMEAKFSLPRFSAGDIFALTGASVGGSGHFERDDLDEAFEEDVLTTWPMVSCNPRAWGEFVAWLQAACAGTTMGTLAITAQKHIRTARSLLKYTPGVLDKLAAVGLLARYKSWEDTVELTFKSPLIKKCLLNQGIWLELYGYVLARRSGCFDDVKTSVVVDWDGADSGPDSTKNEVDIFLIKGVVPVFISCKMGMPTALALSEIKLLAEKFGGGLAQAVMLTAETLGKEHKALRGRAADLGIVLVDGAMLENGLLLDRLEAAASGERLHRKKHLG